MTQVWVTVLFTLFSAHHFRYITFNTISSQIPPGLYTYINLEERSIENGVITWVEDADVNGNPIEGILNIPKEATSFSTDAWIALGCDANGIRVHKDNPVYSSAHNCLLTKNGKKLLKTCKNSDVSKLTGLKSIGKDAFQTMGAERDEFIFRIPDGVEVLDYRAFAISADRVEIIVPASVIYVNLLAFMIHSQHTHIIFEGDTELRIGAFGTAAEAADSGFELYQSMPAILYPKAENITVTCQPGSKVSRYCKKYGIPEV